MKNSETSIKNTDRLTITIHAPHNRFAESDKTTHVHIKLETLHFHLSQPKAQTAQAKLEADIRRNIRLWWFITNQSPRKPTRDYYSLWRLFSIGLYAHSKSATPVFFTFKPFAEQPQRRCLSKSYDWSYHNGKSFHLKLARKIFKFEGTTDHKARKVYNAVCNILVVES